MSIFKAYDIRGVYGKELDDEKAEKISKAFVNLLKAKKAVVGMDVRITSKRLKDSVIRGMLSQGCDVVDIGLVPIPLFYFFMIRNNIKAGIYVTGSHDDPSYNGLKLCKSKAIDLTYETGIAKLEKTYNKNYPDKGKGRLTRKNVSKDYINNIVRNFKLRPLRVVVDSGNGSWSKLAPSILRKAGLKVTEVFCSFDGTFPNRSPEPLEKNLTELKRIVRKTKSDLGMAYDADGDRVVFIDERGKFASPDVILMLFAKRILKKGDSIVATISCTKAMEELSKAHKWRLFWIRVGRSYVKQMMFKTKAVLGGEITGHYFFKENKGYDDGVFASLMMTNILSAEAKPLSQLLKELPVHPSLDIRLHCKENDKKTIIKRAKNEFKEHELITIDGIGIKFKDGFALIRPSNTEEKMELKIEAVNKGALKRIRKQIKKKLGI